MVEKHVTDGKRIAQLLASELTGRETDVLAETTVVDADPDVEPTEDGALAYRVTVDGDRVAEVYVQPDRAYLELTAGLDAGTDTAESEGLRTRPKAVEPPRALVFVESGAAVMGAVQVVVAAGRGAID